MPDLENMLMLATGGLFVGGLYYAYSKNLINFDDSTGGGSTEPDDDDDSADNPAYTGGYAYYSKKKIQCRDNHLTAEWLRGQGVNIINWKVYNDGKVYPQVCGQVGPLWVLAAVPVGDGKSGGILTSLGFSQYMPPQSELNPNVPIPAPPASNLAYSYAGRRGRFTAHRTYRY